MPLLKDLISLSVVSEKAEDLSKLPKDVMSEIKANIRKGAEDLSQQWANALELVHRAYLVAGVERPDPSMETAWKQYEDNIIYAVQQLADNRGMEGDWRMSSAMFHEALEYKPNKYRIEIVGSDNDHSYIIEAKNFDEVVGQIKETTSYDVNIYQNSFHNITLTFSRWGIRKNTKINISRLV